LGDTVYFWSDGNFLNYIVVMIIHHHFLWQIY
jgi:hypothetical protein